MVQTPAKQVTLAEFLNQPETKPASEYLNGQIVQKFMPKARHARIQAKLLERINQVAESQKVAYAFPELRCTFSERSIVPDIAVLRWDSIQFDCDGVPLDDVLTAPDWTIEILSLDQSSNRVTGNILHCLKFGCQLGWLIDPSDRSILVFRPQQQPEHCYGTDGLKLLFGLEMTLTPAQIFDWLKMS